MEERLARAAEVLGPGVRIARHQKSKTARKASSFVPKKTRGKRSMSRSEYRQCGKKIRYKTRTDANAAVRSCERARGTKLRVYFCDICGGYHITHVADKYGRGRV